MFQLKRLGKERVQQESPWIELAGYAPHGLDLVMEDISTKPGVKDLDDTVKRLSRWVNRHHDLRFLYEQFDDLCSFLVSVDTRFASQFSVLARFVRLYSAVRTFLFSNELGE